MWRVSGELGAHCLVNSGTWTLWERHALSFGRRQWRETADSVRGVGVWVGEWRP